MDDILAGKEPALEQLCRQNGVELLELFGSAARGDFDPDHSDVDFLVLFSRDGTMSKDDRYFGLLEGLRELFGREVDLVDVRAHRNPFFMSEALKHRRRLYAA